ncbi:hypothetical protein ATCC90586_009633 [Pythium insidiosum]|nr:hypothetical protein ATCC90586_009633 [Pythium insidiosum]
MTNVRRVAPTAESLVPSSSRATGCTPSPRGWRFGLCVLIIVVQTLWAVAIPLKNVIVMPYPRVVADQLARRTLLYDRDNPAAHTRRVPGRQVLEVIEAFVDLALGNAELRTFFETKGDLAIDEAGSLLSPEQHQLVAQFYALVFQASEFPAGGFVAWQHDNLQVQRSSDKQWVPISLSCASDATMKGMRCENPDGGICDDSDWSNRAQQLTLTPIELDEQQLGARAGWSNKISTLSMITWTHQILRALFSKKDWPQVYKELNELQYHDVLDGGKVIRYSEANAHSIVTRHVFNDSRIGAWLDLGYTKFESCFGSEHLIAVLYANYFSLQLVEQRVLRYSGFKATARLVPALDYLDNVVADAFWRHDVVLSSGAGALAFEDQQNNFVGSEMTRFTASVAALKLNRPMTGPMLMGSSYRMLQYMSWYPDSYYSFLRASVAHGDTVVADWRQLGGYHAGFNGFKFDFTRNTMTVYRLAERLTRQGSGYAADWFEQEATLADWFVRHEASDPLSLVALVRDVWGADDANVFDSDKPVCTEALLRKITQSAWIWALKRQPVLNFLAYMAMTEPDDPATWFRKQMTVREVVGEGLTGYRVAFPFSRDVGKQATGSEWVLVPLLHAFLRVLNASTLVEELLSEMDATFLELIEVEKGNLMLRDADHCGYGRATLGVHAADSKSDVWLKLRPRMRETLARIVGVVPAIHDQLNAVVSVTVPHEYVVYNRSSNIFPSEGPPVYWQHTPLSVGLVKLAAKIAPLPGEVDVWRRSLTCYDTLELRYLNVSTRCWAEPDSVEEHRERTRAEGLRLLQFSMWSLGVVLNLIAAVVSLTFLRRVWRLWRVDGFSDLTLALALNLDVQGLGMISFEGVVIMAFSSVPLMLSYHLPNDARFMETTAQTSRSEAFAECVVLLSLTWFVRLGIALGDGVVRLKHFNWWFNALTSKIRYATLVAIVLLRQAFRVDGVDYNMALSKLIASCVGGTLLGFLSIAVSLWFDRPRSSDPLSQLMAQHGLARNVHGTVGQFGGTWTQTGLVMEGWQALTVDGQLQALVQGAPVLLPLTNSGTHESHRVEVRALPKDFLASELKPRLRWASSRRRTTTKSLTRVLS